MAALEELLEDAGLRGWLLEEASKKKKDCLSLTNKRGKRLLLQKERERGCHPENKMGKGILLIFAK